MQATSIQPSLLSITHAAIYLVYTVGLCPASIALLERFIFDIVRSKPGPAMPSQPHTPCRTPALLLTAAPGRQHRSPTWQQHGPEVGAAQGHRAPWLCQTRNCLLEQARPAATAHSAPPGPTDGHAYAQARTQVGAGTASWCLAVAHRAA